MKIGVFSDAHGVIGAFENACTQLRSAGATKLIFLGDAIGYVPHLGALRALIGNRITSVRGNHEEMLITGVVPDGKDEIYQLSFVREIISNAERDFVHALPKQISETLKDVCCLFLHGSPSDPVKGYVYPDTDLQPFASLVEHFDVVFMGNTHRPFIREYKGTLYVNVGSCGLPRDGARHGTACVFDVSNKEAVFIDLDITEAAKATLKQTAPAAPIARYLKHFSGLR